LLCSFSRRVVLTFPSNSLGEAFLIFRLRPPPPSLDLERSLPDSPTTKYKRPHHRGPRVWWMYRTPWRKAAALRGKREVYQRECGQPLGGRPLLFYLEVRVQGDPPAALFVRTLAGPALPPRGRNLLARPLHAPPRPGRLPRGKRAAGEVRPPPRLGLREDSRLWA